MSYVRGVERERPRSYFVSDKPSRTHKSFKDSCDINKIMGKYRKTGVFTHLNLKRQVFGDFSSIGDFQESQNALLAAQDLFDALPSRLRARVDNDPGKLIAFMSDDRNDSEMLELGLVNPVVDGVAPSMKDYDGEVESILPKGEKVEGSAVQGVD